MGIKTALKARIRGGLILAASRLPHRGGGTQCLMYHSIVRSEERDPRQLTVSVGLLARQLEYLRDNGYRVEEAAALVTRPQGARASDRRSVALTFDDGYANNSLALPLLQDFGYRATIFLVADVLAGRLRPEGSVSYLDVAQAREMLASGVVSFGCHSASHRNLRGLSGRELEEETVGAKQRIEDALGAPVNLFAYPFGSFDAWNGRVRDAVEQAGFAGAFTSIYGANIPGRDPFLLRRSRVSWAEEVRAFRRLLSGGYDWLAAVQWLQARRAPNRAVQETAGYGGMVT